MDTAIDVGNTAVKTGFFEKGSLLESFSFPTFPLSNLYTKLEGRFLDNCILSSVVRIPEHVLSYLKIKSKLFINLDHKTPLPIRLSYNNAGTLGSDRIALAVAAGALYPERDVLVIGMGSCITYNIISKEAEFLGGAISPGLQMRFRAMNAFTSGLPLAEATEETELAAKDTEAALASGVVNGIIFETEGFVRKLKETYKQLAVIISGGDSRYFAERISFEADLQPEMALSGLQKILDFNVKKKKQAVPRSSAH
jgi:type III pantothenate kinase